MKPINKFTITKGRLDLSQLNGNGRAVYIFEQTGGSKNKAFERLIRDCIKLELPPPNNKASDIMYVGKVSTGEPDALLRRITNHTQNNSQQTGALRLNRWFDQLGSHYRYKITILEFDKNIDSEILSLVEAAVWLKLRPAFGSLGKKSREGTQKFKLYIRSYRNSSFTPQSQSQIILDTLYGLGGIATQDEIIHYLNDNGLDSEQAPHKVFITHRKKLVTNGYMKKL